MAAALVAAMSVTACSSSEQDVVIDESNACEEFRDIEEAYTQCQEQLGKE